MTRLWRLCKQRYIGNAFDGEGARQHGGRWNSPGNPMVYTADSAALSTLEVLVNLDETSLLPSYALIPAELDDDHIVILDEGDLPADWRQLPPPESTQRIGDSWLEEGASPGLSVPSTVVPGRNILLNPMHPDRDALDVLETSQWGIDPRLVGSD